MDYPIWSNKQILSALEDNPLKQYIIGSNITLSSSAAHRNKVIRYHFFRDLHIANKSIKRISNIISYRILSPAISLFIRKKPNITIKNKEYSIYYGSSWWCLTYECLRNLWPIISSKEFEKYFKYAYTPDELMIQTAFFNSTYTQHGIIYPPCKKGPYLKQVTLLHYIEYGSAIKIFRYEDFDTLIKSGKMFFRKAQTGQSDQLLDAIDIYRKNNS